MSRFPLGWLVYGESELPIVDITLDDGMVVFHGRQSTQEGEVFGIDQNTGVAILDPDRKLVKMQPRKGMVPDLVFASNGGNMYVTQTVRLIE